MAVIDWKDAFYLKSRPSRYKASDAAYPVGGNKGMVLASYPKDYPKNSQQKLIAKVADACDIEAGIAKSKLQKQMKNCVPDKYDELA